MSSVFKNRQINSRYGIFFQLSVFLVAIVGSYRLGEIFYYSLTDFNMVNKKSFVGFENYWNLFKDDVIQKSLGNTVVMVCIVAILLIVTAILPAIFTSRLKLPFGLGVMGAYSCISLCAMLPNFLNIFFSSDSYGMLNSLLLSKSIIDEPIKFTQTYPMILMIIIMWLHCLAPVFSITYIAARMNHSFLGTAIAVCTIPVLMFGKGSIVANFIGYPSTDYSADWLYTLFNDYLNVRYVAGFAYAILIVGILMLIGWCLAVFSVTFGFRALCKKVKSNSTCFKVLGYITFALSLLLFFTVLIFLVMYFSKALMPIDELLTFPNNFFVKRPTIENFYYLSEFLGSSFPYSRLPLNSLFIIPLTIMPVCLYVALPSGVGFGAFNAFKYQKLFLLCFILFLFVGGYFALAKMGIINTYYVYMFEFLSSFEFLIAVFLVYLTVKLVFYDRKLHIISLLLGIFSILSWFYAIGIIRGMWYGNNSAIFDEKLKTWRDFAAYLSVGGIARSGVSAANDLLMVIVTAAVVIVPLAILLALYLLYRKNTKTSQQ